MLKPEQHVLYAGTKLKKCETLSECIKSYDMSSRLI